MIYQEFKPDASLQQSIDAYWYADNAGGSAGLTRIFPDACIDIIFNIGPDSMTDTGGFLMQQEKIYLVGTMLRYKMTEMPPGTQMIGVRFKPGAFHNFYQIDALHEFVDKTIEFDRKLVPEITPGSKTVCSILDKFFTDRQERPKNKLLLPLELIKNAKGKITVEKLSKACNVSIRQLERIFKTGMGIAPKEFISFTRYQQALEDIRNNRNGRSLLDLAFDHGYYDHSHLSNEIRKYSGLSPSEL